MDKKYLLTESKVFCLAPWTAIHTWPNGNVYPCCAWLADKPVGNLNVNKIEEIWNSDQIKDARLKLLNDEEVSACKICYENYGNSYREGINNRHKNDIDYLNYTNEDGSLDVLKFNLWDIRISNLCNLKCRMCGLELSSSWYQDSIKMGREIPHNNAIITINDKNDFMTTLEPHFDYVNEIYFAGGEPLIMSEHYEIIEKLIDKKKTNIHIRYSTNFSKLIYKNIHIFDYWKKFNNLEVLISVDGFGKIGEYIRKGFDTKVFLKNVNEFFDSGIKYKTFGYVVTYGLMNYLHLFDLILFFLEKNILNKTINEDLKIAFEFQPIREPSYYNSVYLPKEYKEKFKERLKGFSEELRNAGVDGYYRHQLIQKLNDVYIFSNKNETNVSVLKSLFHVTDILDEARNEKFEDTFDYFKDLRKYIE